MSVRPVGGMTAGRVVRVLLVAVVVAAAVVVGAERAGACSCLAPMVSAANRIAEAPYAFAGTAVGETSVRIEVVAKGNLRVGDTVTLERNEGSSCGSTSFTRGEEIAVLAYGPPDQMSEGACTGATVAEVRAYTGELPASQSGGPIVAVLAARYGPATLVGLDAAGLPVRFGVGERPSAPVACPGGARLLTLQPKEQRGAVLRWWDTASLSVVRVADVPFAASNLACIDGEGTAIVAEQFAEAAEPDVVRVGPDGTVERLRTAAVRGLTLAEDGSLVVVETDGQTVARRDLVTGASDRIGAVPAAAMPWRRLVAAPDGRAAVVFDDASGPSAPALLVADGRSFEIGGGDVSFLADGTVAARVDATRVGIWARSGELVRQVAVTRAVGRLWQVDGSLVGEWRGDARSEGDVAVVRIADDGTTTPIVLGAARSAGFAALDTPVAAAEPPPTTGASPAAMSTPVSGNQADRSPQIWPIAATMLAVVVVAVVAVGGILMRRARRRRSVGRPGT